MKISHTFQDTVILTLVFLERRAESMEAKTVRDMPAATAEMMNSTEISGRYQIGRAFEHTVHRSQRGLMQH